MRKPSWIIPTLAVTLFLSCSGDTPVASPTTARVQHSATPASMASKSPQQEPSSGSAGGGGGGGSSRAERDEAYQRTRKEFPQQPSVGLNPTELRAKLKPKTIADVSNFSGYEEVSEMIPASTSVESEQSGKELYVRACIACHSVEGAPVTELGNLASYNMANLSDPLRYKYGADARGIFRSIAFGVPAPPHGIYRKRLSNAQIWNITNFVLSIQKSP